MMSIDFGEITNVEGLRDFLKEQIYETIYPYVLENNLNKEADNPLYLRIRKLIKRVNNLTTVYLNEKLSHEERNLQVQTYVNELYSELTDIQINIGYGKQKNI